jgi:hypothetical protein
LYLNAAGLYSNLPEEDKQKVVFIERVEEIISKESTRYFAAHSQKEASK